MLASRRGGGLDITLILARVVKKRLQECVEKLEEAIVINFTLTHSLGKMQPVQLRKRPRPDVWAGNDTAALVKQRVDKVAHFFPAHQLSPRKFVRLAALEVVASAVCAMDGEAGHVGLGERAVVVGMTRKALAANADQAARASADTLLVMCRVQKEGVAGTRLCLGADDEEEKKEKKRKKKATARRRAKATGCPLLASQRWGRQGYVERDHGAQQLCRCRVVALGSARRDKVLTQRRQT